MTLRPHTMVTGVTIRYELSGLARVDGQETRMSYQLDQISNP